MTIRVLVGDVREQLRLLPADSFDCVVTSPPYWGLRDYGVDGQIGLEPTLGEHLAVMVDVFREVRRVLKPTGTLWLNYGDCYATTPNGRSAADTKATGNDDRTFRDKPFSTIGGALKAKDLCMIPNRLAIALQEDGWWVRAENVWGKNNPMPDSAGRYRPSTSHEKVFLLTKTGKSFYDWEEVAQPASASTHARLSQDVQNQVGSTRANAGGKTNGNMKAVRGRQTHGRHTLGDALPEAQRRKVAGEGSGIKNNESMDAALAIMPETRFLRNFEPAPLAAWVISTQPFREAHFATFPPELVERCLKAGCPAGGSVLDPFGGAGTTALVADQMQLDATIIELNPDYVHIAVKRIEADRGALENARDPLLFDWAEGAAA
jgi:DNA modification methylase